jgi:hypothetical protein
VRSKRRILADGTAYGSQKLSRGALYLMLQNRIYRDEITHKGNAYPGEHPAIVDEALWDKVQSVLAENWVDRSAGSDAKYPSLLAGLAFDETGERLTPTHAVKKGTRYRYYVSRSRAGFEGRSARRAFRALGQIPIGASRPRPESSVRTSSTFLLGCLFIKKLAQAKRDHCRYDKDKDGERLPST